MSIIQISKVSFIPAPVDERVIKGAELIYKLGGCVRPPVVDRDASCFGTLEMRYILISGQFEMTCALLAREKYGVESINAYIINSNNKEDFEEALALFS
jgi:hypothetical protein